MKYVTRTAEEKQALLEEWHASGLSMRAFAKLRGIPQSSMHKWIAPERRRRVSDTEISVAAFLDVEVVDPPRGMSFRVELAGSGHRVDVPQGFDATELRRLVAALC
jgi:transposase-like protein